MLKQDAFDMEAYTEAYLTLAGAKELNAYSDEYETLTENWLDANEQFGETRAQLRSDSIRGEACLLYTSHYSVKDELSARGATLIHGL